MCVIKNFTITIFLNQLILLKKKKMENIKDF